MVLPLQIKDKVASTFSASLTILPEFKMAKTGREVSIYCYEFTALTL